MRERSHPRPGPPGTDPTGTERPRTALVWRLVSPLALVLVGALLVVSARNSEGTDLRPGRYTDLAGLTRGESQITEGLQDRVRDLTAEVDRLGTAVRDERVAGLRREATRLSDPAGLTPRRGQGLRIVLSDAPEDVVEATERDLNLLVVHQQDIQAVVNALWRGGAEAVTIAGQRIITTTGIKCEGNAVQLGGIPYPQPYVIEAVGDQDALSEAVAEDAYLRNYRQQSEIPDIAIGWQLGLSDDVRAPAHAGVVDISHARPISAPLSEQAAPSGQRTTPTPSAG